VQKGPLGRRYVAREPARIQLSALQGPVPKQVFGTSAIVCNMLFNLVNATTRPPKRRLSSLATILLFVPARARPSVWFRARALAFLRGRALTPRQADLDRRGGQDVLRHRLSSLYEAAVLTSYQHRPSSRNPQGKCLHLNQRPIAKPVKFLKPSNQICRLCRGRNLARMPRSMRRLAYRAWSGCQRSPLGMA